MLNFSKTKILSIYLTFLFISVFSLSNFLQFDKSFFNKQINLGLDLQGGSYLLLEVDISSVEKRKIQSKVVPLKKKLNKNSIKFNNFIINESEIKFEIQSKDIEKFENILKNKDENEINNYLDKYNNFELDHKIINNQVNIYLSKYGIISLQNSAVDQSIEIVRRRIDEIGTKEPSILKRGSNRILVELPGVKDPERIKELLGKTAALSFRLVTDNTGEFGTEKFLVQQTEEEITVSKRIILSG